MRKIFELVAADDALWLHVADEDGVMQPWAAIIEVKDDTPMERINRRTREVINSFLAETDLRELFV